MREWENERMSEKERMRDMKETREWERRWKEDMNWI